MIGWFNEISKGYSRKEVIKEASRCFHCGHCAICRNCVELCPLDVLVMEEEGLIVAYPTEC
ncbi:MAG: hypothetical protein JSV55_00920 [Deltaproteobacteria bacterium]|nr:MAG: hypothetical protein JSV55_00920 [Deltaproteobacteria bacterium]